MSGSSTESLGVVVKEKTGLRTKIKERLFPDDREIALLESELLSLTAPVVSRVMRGDLQLPVEISPKQKTEWDGATWVARRLGQSSGRRSWGITLGPFELREVTLPEEEAKKIKGKAKTYPAIELVWHHRQDYELSTTRESERSETTTEQIIQFVIDPKDNSLKLGDVAEKWVTKWLYPTQPERRSEKKLRGGVKRLLLLRDFVDRLKKRESRRS